MRRKPAPENGVKAVSQASFSSRVSDNTFCKCLKALEFCGIGDTKIEAKSTKVTGLRVEPAMTSEQSG
jgi:hypothetical protein